MAFKTGAEYSSTSVLVPLRTGLTFITGMQSGWVTWEGFIQHSHYSVFPHNSASVYNHGVYVLHRFEFNGKKIITTLFTLTMFIPVTTQTVVFQIIYRMGLVNKMPSVILLYSGVNIVGVYIMFNQLN